jgi:sugar lactone lactonase YvrE
MQAQLAIDSKDIIGEGPMWDAAAQRLLWMDNAVGTVHEAKATPHGSWLETRKWTLNRVTGMAIPRKNGGLVVMAGTDILTLSDAGDVSTFATIPADPNKVKLNDARCDPQGRLWTGTYAHDFTPGISALYRIDHDGTVTTVLEQVGLSNGMDWSPDGKTFYYIDSMAAEVAAFDFDPTRGTLSRRRKVVHFPATEGGLDGMTVDSEGCLWLADFGPGEVRRYSPEGRLLTTIKVSALAVTSCAFGGAGYRDLFITTAALRIPDPVLPIIGWTPEMADNAANSPGSGGVFVCRPGVAGHPETPFAG